jgi:F0F1-type ATP synthase membrane subunit b/b'
MTFVGKILAFVNLVFSLVVGGLVMVVFMTRANWEDQFKKLQAEYTVIDKDRQQTAADKKQLQTDLTEMKQSWRNAVLALARGNDKEAQDLEKLGAAEVVKRASEARDQAEREKKAVQGQLDAINAGGVKGNADITAAQAASEARKDQIKELENALTEERKDKRKLIDDANNDRRERIRAQIAARTLERANEALEDQVRDLAKELARNKAGVTTPVAGRKRGEENPPPEDLEGQVLSVSGNLVHISIGSDAGLAQGHTLKVFRLDRVPENSKFLGVIEILSVRPHEAVGRPVRRSAYEMRKGDRVASRIVVGGS